MWCMEDGRFRRVMNNVAPVADVAVLLSMEALNVAVQESRHLYFVVSGTDFYMVPANEESPFYYYEKK